MRQKFDILFERYIKPRLIPGRTTVTFPEPFTLCNPFAVMLLKIIENNDDFNILTPADFDGFDVPSQYGKDIGYKRDFGAIAYIFVEDHPIFIDYKDWTFFHNCPTGALAKTKGPDVVDGVIKCQFARLNYKDSPFPVYPFMYPGPNDYFSVKGYPKYYDVSLREQFLNCCENNSFTSSVFARWAGFPMRKKFTQLADQIPNSDVSTKKNMEIHEYMKRMSQSKFALAARGNGKLSHREMEACSIGVPLLRQDTGELMWNPFIPGKHYIPITKHNFLETFRYYDEHYDEALEIAENGHQYYLENHAQKGIQKVFKEIVETIMGERSWTQA